MGACRSERGGSRDRTLGFRGREKFSTLMFLSVDSVLRLPGRESALEVVDVGVSGGRCVSFCRDSKGNLRPCEGRIGGLLGASGMNGLEEKPGKADRGVSLGVGVESALIPRAVWPMGSLTVLGLL